MTSDLNEQQKAIVDAAETDLCVTAAAGSGKTRVLTERFVAHVMGAQDIRRGLESLLTITFTEKAAGEITERIRQRLAGASAAAGERLVTDCAWISTIHGLCARLLRRHGLDIGLDPELDIGSDVELGSLKQRAFEDAAVHLLEQPHAGIGPLLDAFTRSTLFRAADAAFEFTRSLGIATSEIRVHPADHVPVRVCVEDLVNVLDRLRRIQQTKTARDNVAVLEEAIAAISGCLPDRSADSEAICVLARFGQKKTGSPELKALAAEAEEIAQRALAHLAQCAVREHECAFLALTSEYAQAYTRGKAERGLLDFEDLQLRTVELFERFPSVARCYAGMFAGVMIDEFQDTNALQMRVVGALTRQGLLTVGDEKQSIYGFRHADVGIFKRRREEAASARGLRVNYRSHPNLVAFLNDAFSREPFWPGDFLGLEPGLEAADDARAERLLGPSRVTALLIDAGVSGDDARAAEAAAVAAHVRHLVDGGMAKSDIVLLLRAMPKADLYADALRAQGIEAFVASGRTYYDRPEVRDVEMLLRVAANPLDCEALAHVLAGPMTSLSDDALAKIRLNARNGNLWAACRSLELLELCDRDVDRLRGTLDTIEEMRGRAGRVSLYALIHRACERLKYDVTLCAQGWEGARSWANVLKLARLAEEFEQTVSRDPSAFVEHISLKRGLASPEGQAAFAVEGLDAVRIMSIHASKGLEFPVVIVADLAHRRPGPPGIAICRDDEGFPVLGMRLPAAAAGQEKPVTTLGHERVVAALQERELAEEKRIFYVACSRAQDGLVLAGRTRFEAPSGSELPIDWIRRLLGFTEPGSVRAGDVRVGRASIRVLTPKPEEPATHGADFPPAGTTDAHPAAAVLPRSPAEVHHSDPVPDRVSFSGLRQYLTCPYRYYIERVARLGSTDAPAGDSVTAATRGSAIHAVLSVSALESLPPPERIDEICRANGVPPEVIGEVTETCERFLASPSARRLMKADLIQREAYFAVSLSSTILDGALDLIAWFGDDALVVDYKTGGAPSAAEEDRHRPLQAHCYALAAMAMGARSISVEFVELDSSEPGTTYVFQGADEPELRAEIGLIVDSIMRQRFDPRPAYDPIACRECPAATGLCPKSRALH